MNSKERLQIFQTIYLWIFVIKVLQVSGERYRDDTNAIHSSVTVDDLRNGGGGGGGFRGGVMIKPLTSQIFDDYTDEWINERGTNNAVAATLPPTAAAFWQTLNKQLYKRLLAMTKNFKTITNNNYNNVNKHEGNALTSKEMNFAKLNDFGRYGPKANSQTYWPTVILQPQHLASIYNGIQQEDDEQQRHSLSNTYVKDVGYKNVATATADAGKDVINTVMGDVRSKQRPRMSFWHKLLPPPLFMETFFKPNNIKTSTTTKLIKRKGVKVKKSNDFTLTANSNNNRDDDDNYDDNDNNNGRGDDVREAIKENLFPLLRRSDKEESSLATSLNLNVNGASDDANGIANSNGNGNESLNYADNSILNTNYFMAASGNNDIDSEHQQHIFVSRMCDDKRAKPSVGHTPFLPAISGGAMTNLGKFFRDLSKNVHFSEQYQWSGQQQKLLEGDPNFSNIQHHLEKPNAATDQQTAEWIKAIRFYRPSQKIRSLVAMNPHGNWDHSSQFIDPNYMWVGLGK